METQRHQPDGKVAPVNGQAGRYGYVLKRVAAGWSWCAYDPFVRTRSSGVAPTRATAAALIIAAHTGVRRPPDRRRA